MTAPTVDDIFGDCYIEPADFTARAKAFGCSRALTGLSDTDGTIATTAIALASRAIDIYTSRDPGSWSGATIYENHPWDPATRRCKVNQPPVSNLISYKVRVGAQLTANFVLTPVGSDTGSNELAYGGVYYNRQENYLELTSLALAGSLTNSLAGLGMTQAQVEIAYTSFAAIPQSVRAAAGFAAASILNECFSNILLPPGIKSLETGDQSVTKDNLYAMADRFILPPQASRFLYGLTRIAVG